MRISDWSSDVCSSDLVPSRKAGLRRRSLPAPARTACCFRSLRFFSSDSDLVHGAGEGGSLQRPDCRPAAASSSATACAAASQSLPVSWPRSQRVTTSLASSAWRSEGHTSELQSLMRISYAVFCLKKKKQQHIPVLLLDRRS